ncbi:cAMP-responsive element-binding protein-like 2 isoform 1-T1 [Theristicus caerulescens]
MDDSKVVGGKVKKPGKRGRKPAKIDLKAKLERSRQSARECRARKKLRYQYLEELVSSRERAICALREELEMYKQWCMAMDQGKIPSEIKALLTGEEQGKAQQNSIKLAKAGKTEANSSNPCERMQNLPHCNRDSLVASRRMLLSEKWMHPRVQGEGSKSAVFSLLLPT